MRKRTQDTLTHTDADTGSLPAGSVHGLGQTLFECNFVNLCCVLNALCQSGVNRFKSFNLCTLDALDYICFMFYSARFTAHPDMIKGSFNICNVSFCVCFFIVRQKTSVSHEVSCSPRTRKKVRSVGSHLSAHLLLLFIFL